MNAVTVSAAVSGAMTMPAFKADFFTGFVEYVDRTERTAKTYLNNLKQFAAWLKFSGIASPTRLDIIAYRGYLMSEHKAVELCSDESKGWRFRKTAAGAYVIIKCKAATVRSYLQVVRSFFAWTAAAGLYPNIALNIHAPKADDSHKKEALTASQVVQVEDAIKAAGSKKTEAARTNVKDTYGRITRSREQELRLQAMYQLAVTAGLRTVELSRANIGDMETINGQTVLYVWGKGRSEADQKKAVPAPVKALIDEYLEARTDAKTPASPLFVSTGNRSGGRRIAETTISTMLKGALKAAGFDSSRYTAHSLRHTAGQGVMELTGHNIYKTQMYMRHASPKTTEVYLDNKAAADDGDMAARLYAHYHGTEDTQDATAKLTALLSRMTPEQISQIAGIAAAVVR